MHAVQSLGELAHEQGARLLVITLLVPNRLQHPAHSTFQGAGLVDLAGAPSKDRITVVFLLSHSRAGVTACIVLWVFTEGSCHDDGWKRLGGCL